MFCSFQAVPVSRREASLHESFDPEEQNFSQSKRNLALEFWAEHSKFSRELVSKCISTTYGQIFTLPWWIEKPKQEWMHPPFTKARTCNSTCYTLSVVKTDQVLHRMHPAQITLQQCHCTLQGLPSHPYFHTVALGSQCWRIEECRGSGSLPDPPK